jgi:Heterokaryon incompatibility protein (HET)
LHFLLLREWLKICDESHHDHALAKEDKPLPTRVLDVGDDINPDVRLYLPRKAEEGKEGERGRYIALSHRWGNGDKKPLCTTKTNLEALRKGIELDQLPKTFQDAVKVTRQLGVRYLWIDSLCIIQDDDDDWICESRKMEAVFASAYCTIAATSAKESTEGFLIPRSVEPPIRLQDPDDSQLYAYVSRIDENFDCDLEEAELNQRAWVFQERALSCRTIHFTAGQTYWECGSVICCETLIQMIRWVSSSCIVWF